MTEKTTQTSPKGRFPTPYVMIWALLASVSLVYLALLAFKPALVAHYLGSERDTAGAAPMSQALEITANDIRAVKDSVSRVQVDLADLKAEISGQASRERDLTDRITALETGATDPAKVAMLNGAPAQPASAVQPASRAPTDKSAERSPAKAASDQKAASPPAAQAPPVVIPGTSIASSQAKPVKAPAKAAPPIPQATLETGSVAGAGAPVRFGPPIVTPAAGTPVTVTPAAKSLGLQIATGPSVDALRLSWSLLSDRHADSLKPLEPRYVTGANSSGLTYDLIVGPIASATEAKRICKELGQNGTQCKVGNFAGDAL